MKRICSLLLACFCFHQSLLASALIFVNIDGIPGESTDPNHLNQIQALSFSINAVQPKLNTYVGSAASAAKSQFTPLVIFKEVDKTSPLLLVDCALGKMIKTVTLSVYDNGSSVDYFKIVLSNVVISSVEENQANGGDLPLESVSFGYQKIQWIYTPYSPGGGTGAPVSGAFDLIRNKQIQTLQ